VNLAVALLSFFTDGLLYQAPFRALNL